MSLIIEMILLRPVWPYKMIENSENACIFHMMTFQKLAQNALKMGLLFFLTLKMVKIEKYLLLKGA